MTPTVSESLQRQFKLLETEHEISQMEADIEFSKEQTLLIREAIKEKRNLIREIRKIPENCNAQEENHDTN
jgi:hypothetical protein